MELITLWTAVEMTENSSNAHEKLLGAAAAGAKIIVLPRHFDSLYGCQHFPSYALPPAAHPEVYFRSYLTLSAMAKDTGTQASWTMTWVEKGARGLTYVLSTRSGEAQILHDSRKGYNATINLHSTANCLYKQRFLLEG